MQLVRRIANVTLKKLQHFECNFLSYIRNPPNHSSIKLCVYSEYLPGSKHEFNYGLSCGSAASARAISAFEKLTHANQFQIERGNPHDYLLIIQKGKKNHEEEVPQALNADMDLTLTDT